MKTAFVAAATSASLALLVACQKSPPPPDPVATPAPPPKPAAPPTLWEAYQSTFKQAKYIDLTHAFNPSIPVWPGFGPAKFKPSVAGHDVPDLVKKGAEFKYKPQGFIATAYEFTTDQYGTQLDPPAHWDEYGATISDLPPTFSVRPLVVIDIHEQAARDPNYHCTVADIQSWETRHGTIPEGSVVMIRSDWYKKWNEPQRFANAPFPGIKLDALKFLHLERKILFHGHEALDTDTTPSLEGESWLMHNHFAQAEGVANLDQVPEAGALISIGFAKPEGGTGGYARYVAIAPPDWPHGVTIAEAPGAPLPKQPFPLKRDKDGVLRPTKETK
ncbi:cyclase family protein [Pendulispora rubella]|uniref:Cyclase family protein n=1 Tax=Pendulispora rubella TaxID=2741070 RepID=A0ABZ2KSA4_9BACT